MGLERDSVHSPTKRRVIFSPSHKAHEFPIHVRMCKRGPSVEPLTARSWSANGTWFVMSPRARNGANNRRELGISSDTTARGAAPALVSEDRTLFRGGRVELVSSSSTSTVIVAIVPVTGDRYFLRLVYDYIIHLVLKPRQQTMMDLSHPRLLVVSFLVAILTVGEYCTRDSCNSLSCDYSRPLPHSS